MFVLDVLLRRGNRNHRQLAKVRRIASYQEDRSVRVLMAFARGNWRPMRMLTRGPLGWVLGGLDRGDRNPPFLGVKKEIARSLAQLAGRHPGQVIAGLEAQRDNVLLCLVIRATDDTQLLWKLAPLLQKYFFFIDSYRCDTPYWYSDYDEPSGHVTTFNSQGFQEKILHEAMGHITRVVGKEYTGDPYRLLNGIISPGECTEPSTLVYLVDALEKTVERDWYPESWTHRDRHAFAMKAVPALKAFLAFAWENRTGRTDTMWDRKAPWFFGSPGSFYNLGERLKKVMESMSRKDPIAALGG